MRFGNDRAFQVMIPDMTVNDLKTRVHDGRHEPYPKLRLGGWNRGNWRRLGEMSENGKSRVWEYFTDRELEYEIVVE